MLFPDNSSSSHYRETGGKVRGVLIAWQSSTSLLDEEVIEESEKETETWQERHHFILQSTSSRPANIIIIIIINIRKRALAGIWTPDLYLTGVSKLRDLTKVTLYQAELPRQLNEQSSQ